MVLGFHTHTLLISMRQSLLVWVFWKTKNPTSLILQHRDRQMLLLPVLSDCHCTLLSDSGSVAYVSLQEPEGPQSESQCFPVRQHHLKPLCTVTSPPLSGPSLGFNCKYKTDLVSTDSCSDAVIMRCVWFSRMKSVLKTNDCVWRNSARYFQRNSSA